MKLDDLTGRRFNSLTVIRRAPNDKRGKPRWVCKCDCGTETTYAARDLKRGNLYSCGCQRSRRISEKNKTHGMSRHPAWAVWHSMKQRCMDPNHKAWKNYGGRGITVCGRWAESFEAFWEDMGPTYQPGLEIDRIDNNRGYEPGNCRWTTRKVNARNRRTNILVTTEYGTTTVSELAELTGIGETTLLYRIQHGWPEAALTTPPNVRNWYTTSGIAVRGTASQLSQQTESSGL